MIAQGPALETLVIYWPSYALHRSPGCFPAALPAAIAACTSLRRLHLQLPVDLAAIGTMTQLTLLQLGLFEQNDRSSGGHDLEVGSPCC